jgi:ABC-2 type transport system permease protein
VSTPANVPESTVASQTSAPAPLSATRPLLWSVRRELWENRSIYVATLIVACIVLFGFSMSTFHLPSTIRTALALDPAKQHAAIDKPYTVAAVAIMVTAFVVGVSYCLGALRSERRDRSILFWKSLPVSDLTTVLSKAAIPLVVLPVLTFAIIVTTQLIMLLLSSMVLLGSGMDATELWAQVKFFQSALAQLYALGVMTLWYAPIYGWLVLVSGWARRVPFLWAVSPVFAFGVVEKIAFNTSYTAVLLKDRLMGWFTQGFAPHAQGIPIDPLALLEPAKFLGSPGLWLGLVFTAGFLAAAARLRRYRQPI